MKLVQLKIYNDLEKEIAALVNEDKPAGNYEVEFSTGSCGNGSNHANGIYFYSLRTGNCLFTRKMILTINKIF